MVGDRWAAGSPRTPKTPLREPEDPGNIGQHYSNSLARRGKAKSKKQSYKSRRDESKGAKKAAGKRAYSGNKSSAQGRGSASKRADGIAKKGHTRGRHV